MLPSQASQRACSAEIRAPNPVSAAPGPGAGSAKSSRVSTTCGFTVRSVGRLPAAS
jgi:hypothetical protein